MFITILYLETSILAFVVKPLVAWIVRQISWINDSFLANTQQPAKVCTLILKIWKIPNIWFAGNLILSTSREFYENDVAVTPFVNIKYGDVRTEIVPQRTACRYSFFADKKSWCKTDSLAMHSVDCGRSLVYEKCFLDKKQASDTVVQPVVRRWLWQQPASFFASGIQKLVDR